MKKKRFTEQQIHDILKESEAGLETPELYRKYGISKNTFYNWYTVPLFTFTVLF